MKKQNKELFTDKRWTQIPAYTSLGKSMKLDTYEELENDLKRMFDFLADNHLIDNNLSFDGWKERHIAKCDSIKGEDCIYAYKILKYLEECKKHNIYAQLGDFDYESELINIPRKVWNNIIYYLAIELFIEGFIISSVDFDDATMKVMKAPTITSRGELYLKSNEYMINAKEKITDEFESKLQQVIKNRMESI